MKPFLLAALVVFSGSAFAATTIHNQIIEVQVTENGFEPNTIQVKSGTAVTLNVTRKTDDTCARELKFPSRNIKKDLPINKTVSFDLGKVDGNLKFACGMDMITGEIVVN